jgi:hypothetical protein
LATDKAFGFGGKNFLPSTKALDCKKCKKAFSLEGGEQDFFRANGMLLPKSCKLCREESAKEKKMKKQQRTDSTLSSSSSSSVSSLADTASTTSLSSSESGRPRGRGGRGENVGRHWSVQRRGRRQRDEPIWVKQRARGGWVMEVPLSSTSEASSNKNQRMLCELKVSSRLERTVDEEGFESKRRVHGLKVVEVLR